MSQLWGDDLGAADVGKYVVRTVLGEETAEGRVLGETLVRQPRVAVTRAADEHYYMSKRDLNDHSTVTRKNAVTYSDVVIVTRAPSLFSLGLCENRPHHAPRNHSTTTKARQYRSPFIFFLLMIIIFVVFFNTPKNNACVFPR